jgi:hypothetical protein
MIKRISLEQGFALATLFFAIVFAPHAARGQSGQRVGIFLECVTPNPALGGESIAFFGYNNPTSSTVNIAAGTIQNQFIPLPANRFQPSSFAPGVHHFSFLGAVSDGN